jgi:hypothetical protein
MDDGVRLPAPFRRLLLPGRRRFTHVVPLGVSCRVTHQVRTYFGVGDAYPFDWWICPADGVARYLERPEPALVYGPGALAEMRGAHGEVETIRSVAYDFRLFHEFPRAAPPAAGGVAPGWEAHTPIAAARHAERLARLLALDRPGNTILFVRHRHGIAREDPADPEPVVERLWRALCTRYRAADIVLALINLGLRTSPSRRVVAVDFDDPPGPPPDEWRGDARAWSAALGSLGFRPCGTPTAVPPVPEA